MDNLESIEKLRVKLHGWGTFLQDKVTDTAPGTAVDVDSVIFTKLDYIRDVQRLAFCLDGYCLPLFDRMLELAAAMVDEHTIVAAETAIFRVLAETEKYFSRPKTPKQKEGTPVVPEENRPSCTLKQFIETRCNVIHGDAIESKVQLIYKAATAGRIKLPQKAGQWVNGRAYIFFEDDLHVLWSSYTKEIPSLFRLK